MSKIVHYWSLNYEVYPLAAIVNAYNLFFFANFVQDLLLHRKHAGLVFIEMLLDLVHGGFDVALSSRDLGL